ncbi:hypothetical protein ABNR98_004454 [Salmonella enterica]
MSKNIHTFVQYSCQLGKELFPEDNFVAMEANLFFSELFIKNNNAIFPISDFLEKLECFTPAQIQTNQDNSTWGTARAISRWENLIKPLIKRRIIEKLASS